MDKTSWISAYQFAAGKGKVVLVLNWLSTMQWRHKWEWSYSSTFLDLGTRQSKCCEWSASCSCCFAPAKEPDIHWVEGWVGPQLVWMLWRRGKSCTAGNWTWPVRAHLYTDWAISTPCCRYMNIFADISLYTETRPALGSTQPPIKWVPGPLSQG
jgi:hypothetical protein